jgi:hypothetical protein
MDCTLNAIDQTLIRKCDEAEYCVVSPTPTGTEYIVRIGDRIYVMIIPEKPE